MRLTVTLTLAACAAAVAAADSGSGLAALDATEALARDYSQRVQQQADEFASGLMWRSADSKKNECALECTAGAIGVYWACAGACIAKQASDKCITVGCLAATTAFDVPCLKRCNSTAPSPTTTTLAAPARPWMDVGVSPKQRAQALLSAMNVSEKLHMLHGSGSGYVGNVAANDRLGIPALRMNDGPQGFRDDAHPGTSTAFPCGLAVGASFDADLAREWGAAMAEEFLGKGANVQLGPGMCLARVPKNGRNFEYISGEDPYLGARLSAPVVLGIQGGGVIANAKHWVNNNQETDRMTVDEDVDERTQFELYYPPFEAAINAGVGSVMCSYNKIRGRWSCENPDTLQRDLKERLGFDGWVMSDWGATHSVSINAGLDQQMPDDSYMGQPLTAAVAAGNVSEAKVDDSVLRILTPMFAMGLFDRSPAPDDATSNNVTSAAHNAFSRRLAAESSVLLQNEQQLLPIRVNKIRGLKLAVIGAQAAKPIVHGGGSGQVVPYYTSSPLTAIRDHLGIPSAGAGGGAVQPDCVGPAGKICVYYDDGSDTDVAAATAKRADVALVFLGATSSEGGDRQSLGFGGNSDDLVPAVAAANARTAVFMVAPGAVLTPWRAKVQAAVVSFMPGQEYGNAVADLLFGGVNPSGRLPLSFPGTENDEQFSDAQWPGLVDTHGQRTATYSEQLLVGYRWYDARNAAPAYAFGHGLSFSTFAYSDLVVDADALTVSFTLRNAGGASQLRSESHLDGAEVAQLYLAFPAAAGEPPKQLKGFQKVFLKAGESAVVTLPLTPRDLSVWDAEQHQWAPVHGEFGVMAGASSRDIRLNGKLQY